MQFKKNTRSVKEAISREVDGLIIPLLQIKS